MRHQTEDVSLAIADARDVFNRTIRIGLGDYPAAAVRITQNHLSICIELVQCFRVSKKTAFAVRNRQAKKHSFRATVRERRIIHFHPRSDHVADEPQRTIPHERTR